MDTKINTYYDNRWAPWLLNERHISFEVAKAALLQGNANELQIPIMDADGKVLFSKFRRAPWREDGAKYRYAAGNSASLFGAETLKNVQPREIVVITEGELDALALRTLGYNTVSSTGGAGTWRKEWNDILNEFDCVLLYDADRAGVHGAFKVMETGLNASIAWLPVQYGKDPTDVIHSGEADALRECINDAARYPVPLKDAEVDERLVKYRALIERLASERQATLNSPAETPFHRDIALEWARERLQDALEDTYEKNKGAHIKSFEGESGIAAAKAYPIKDLLKFNREWFAKCVYHEEKSESMKLYIDNHCFSYCCNKRSDAIDIYMAVNKCDFKTAIKALTS